VESGPRLWPKNMTAATSSSGGGGGSYPLHPAVIELGYQYANGKIRGGNARCRAMLRVFHKVIGDFQPPQSSLSTTLTTTDMRQQLDQWVLKPSFQYWTESCRPHSVTMGNAFTFLKTAVASLERDMSRDAMVEMVQDTIQAYIHERIDYAQKAIAQQPALQLPSNIRNKGQQQQQVFLTYGKSEAIAAIFLRMAEVSDLSQFRVIVVDSRPLLEGKQLLRTLRAAKIDCSYILLNALTYVMRDVTKVYLGASALMSDGGVLGRVGTACVALSAHMHHIPVLVCCESYKISNRVQLESITGNELGDPEQVARLGNNRYPDSDEDKDSVLKDWLDMDNLRLLNLLYDLTPSDFVSGIVTELGIIPPTSVAVLLREMNPQN
jgi:translation initiation factor eIF-2B subunit delta